MRLFLIAILVVTGLNVFAQRNTLPVTTSTVYVTYKIKTGWGLIDVGMVPVTTTGLSPKSKPNQLLTDLLTVLDTTGRLDNVDITNPAHASVTIIGWQVPRDGVRVYSTDSTEVIFPKPVKPPKFVKKPSGNAVKQ